MRKSNFILVGALAALIAAVWYELGNFPEGHASQGYGPAFYPAILLGVLAFLLVLLFVQTIRSKDEEKISVSAKAVRNAAIFAGLCCVYALLLNVTGFVVDSFLFLVAGMKVLGGKWKPTIVISLCVAAFLYVLFGVIFQVVLPKGMLF